ncbi:nucleotidyltransferase family protein [Devosia sp.]|uniref:nucleotidyltransferase family protein n=1 Tax=Devosia sp. TaxID=1871048 RepID=UPI001AC7F2C3|nr:nucleotidyltransferase family protein [Devosia sp.]MBN9334050.1 nucleotidyltransferase family protein [Devosia sp.]
MGDHLKYSGAGSEAQRRALIEIILADSFLMGLLHGLEELALPDALVASGVVYNTVWNALTGRPSHYGINDADIAYFDPSDRSYLAEDRIIQHVQARFAGSAIPVEVRNQARVHLWFPDKFGLAYPELTCSVDMLLYFATKTHAVAARLDRGEIAIFAPFGIDDLFSFRLTPNPALPNRATHEAKAVRAMQLWPELQFAPWPDEIGD